MTLVIAEMGPETPDSLDSVSDGVNGGENSCVNARLDLLVGCTV